MLAATIWAMQEMEASLITKLYHNDEATLCEILRNNFPGVANYAILHVVKTMCLSLKVRPSGVRPCG